MRVRVPSFTLLFEYSWAKNAKAKADKKTQDKTTTVPHKRKVGGQNWKKPDAEMISREHDEIETQINTGNKHPDWAPDHVQTQLKKLNRCQKSAVESKITEKTSLHTS